MINFRFIMHSSMNIEVNQCFLPHLFSAYTICVIMWWYKGKNWIIFLNTLYCKLGGRHIQPTTNVSEKVMCWLKEDWEEVSWRKYGLREVKGIQDRRNRFGASNEKVFYTGPYYRTSSSFIYLNYSVAERQLIREKI